MSSVNDLLVVYKYIEGPLFVVAVFLYREFIGSRDGRCVTSIRSTMESK